MESKSLNLGTAGESLPNHGKVRKKVRVRVKLDDGKKQKKRKQILPFLFVLLLIVAGLAATFILYKLDQSTAPPSIEVMPPSGG